MTISGRQLCATLHIYPAGGCTSTPFSTEHIYAKLGVKTRTGAALFAMRHGLIGAAGEPGT